VAHANARLNAYGRRVLVERVIGAGRPVAHESTYSDLTVTGFLGHNLLPVTFGNIGGRGAMIGIVYWTVFHRFAETSPDLEATDRTKNARPDSGQ
jgi:hypothetical protein